MQIETAKLWNQTPLAICDKCKADLFEKPCFCYCYKWIPKLFFTPKRGKTTFLSCPQLHFTSTHFLTHSLRIYSNWFLYQMLKVSIRGVQWKKKKKAWPLFKTGLKVRHENGDHNGSICCCRYHTSVGISFTQVVSGWKRTLHLLEKPSCSPLAMKGLCSVR